MCRRGSASILPAFAEGSSRCSYMQLRAVWAKQGLPFLWWGWTQTAFSMSRRAYEPVRRMVRPTGDVGGGRGSGAWVWRAMKLIAGFGPNTVWVAHGTRRHRSSNRLERLIVDQEVPRSNRGDGTNRNGWEGRVQSGDLDPGAEACREERQDAGAHRGGGEGAFGRDRPLDAGRMWAERRHRKVCS